MEELAIQYKQLVENITLALTKARERAVQAVNIELLYMNWQIGYYIVHFEMNDKERAQYGTSLLTSLSRDLKMKLGRGFSKSNLYLYRLFYLKYPNFQTFGKSVDAPQKKDANIFRTASGKSQEISNNELLSWSHYAELLTVSDDLARTFYEKQASIENWSVRELKGQISTSLFERLALSKDKTAVFALAQTGQQLAKIDDIIRDPYVFEFLGLPKVSVLKEKALEKSLLNNLQKFLLELGKGFSFVAQQFKITIDNEHYFIDLVFYHRILKCFVIIDLKTKKVRHQDVGQMNMYLNYFLAEENVEGDNPPIGIIIAADKTEYLVRYATGGLSNKIFISKYQLYLPDQKQLEEKVREILDL